MRNLETGGGLNDKVAASVDYRGHDKGLHPLFLLKGRGGSRPGKVRSPSVMPISQASFPSVEIDFRFLLSGGGFAKGTVGECGDMLIKITATDAAGGNIEGIVKEQKIGLRSLKPRFHVPNGLLPWRNIGTM